jgi:hypothetical protein
MRAVSPAYDPRPGAHGQQAPNVVVLDGVLERVTFCNPETGHMIARVPPCPGELAAWLLGPSAFSGPLADMLAGGEHRELIREYFRSKHRGQLVLGSLPGDGQEAGPVLAAGIDTAPFVDWYAGQHADAPKPGRFRKQAAETAEFLLDA